MIRMLAAYIADSLNREEGASMVEYGLLVALIAVVVAVGAATLGTRIDTLFNTTADSVGAAPVVETAP